MLVLDEGDIEDALSIAPVSMFADILVKPVFPSKTFQKTGTS
jgi:hypothetical protein